MKAQVILFTLALGVSTCLLTAQDGPAPRDGQRLPGRDGGPGMSRGQRPVDLLVSALDLNKDGVIDAEEIAKASESLKKLDKNNDGKLTLNEVRPPRPAGRMGSPGAGGMPGERPGQSGPEMAGPEGPTPDVDAQQPPPSDGAPASGPAGMNNRPFVPPLFAALDLNKDGVIDTEELAKASESLKTLDKNSDGKLTPAEFHPARQGGRMGGPGGHDGFGGPGRQGGPNGPGMGGQDRPQPQSLNQ